ncbi:hypothetical protein DSO57_1038959 [Entomophthora muscae]|uniref:Uncharacterized protein n=1 Tax=Entomophthora muscae TaxID=34485 RepID=A0ACC2SB93_9FUNG|nr:hypothetical protein DSO57_1038959 [Entomophthora muscae]
MAEEEDFSKLSIDDKLQHKSWKARVEGYEGLAKDLKKLDPDSKAGEFRKYGAMMLQIAKDTNLPAQEAGMGCILSFIEYAPNSERLRDELVPVLVQKGLGSARVGTRTKSMEILLKLVEVDVGEPVIDLIVNEFGNKQPKIAAACVMALKSIVVEFGVKAVNVKAILKNIPKFFAHSDKKVREESSGLALALYPWLSTSIDTFLKDLKPVQLKDLNAEFAKLPAEKPKALRLLRSQQALVQDESDEAEAEEASEENSLNEEPVDVDPYELADPVDITSMIPSDFYTQLNAKKWQERKETLEALEKVVNKIRLADSGPYGDLITALTAHINDTNVVVSILSINCIKHIAAGLRNKFAAFKPAVVPPLLMKLKEKKQTFIDALQGCLDAVFVSVTLSDVLDDILGKFGEKNPQIKLETVRWLVRILSSIKAPPSKSEVKKMCEGLLKTYADSDTHVRDASAVCLGTLWKVAGEKSVLPFIEDLDSIKMTKVKEKLAEAVVQVRQAPPPQTGPSQTSFQRTPQKPVQRPTQEGDIPSFFQTSP